MNILYFEPNYTPSMQSYAYYAKQLQAIAKKATVTIINAVGFTAKLDDIIASCEQKPDVILFGYGWMNIWKGGVKYRETTIEGLSNSKIPKAIFLNKEYGGSLPSKLGWIKENNFNTAFTYHHDYNIFSQSTNVKFHHIPFAADPEVFKDYGVKPTYDIGFTGGLGHTSTNGWEKTSEFGKVNPTRPDGQGWSHNLRQQIQAEKHRWKDIHFYFENHHHDNLIDYAKRLQTATMWLSTTGPVDIVGTRYFEVPLTKTTMLICNRPIHPWCFDFDGNRISKNVNVYDGLFEEDKHYIGFENINEFIQKTRYYKSNTKARQEIIDAAYDHCIKHHTWDNRADKVIKILESL